MHHCLPGAGASSGDAGVKRDADVVRIDPVERWCREVEMIRLKRIREIRWGHRACIAMLSVGALSSRVLLAAPAALEDALQICAQEKDDSRRLSCYDRETQNLAHTRDNSFGLTAEQERKSQPTEAHDRASSQTLSSVVSAVSKRPDGRLIITLANGQTWVQGEAWEVFHLSVGDAVTIKHGTLGSFQLSTSSGLSTRVSRAQ
jgi:hypothetical protein